MGVNLPVGARHGHMDGANDCSLSQRAEHIGEEEHHAAFSIRLDVVCPDMELEEQNGQQIVTKAIRMANEGPITDMLTKLGLPGPQIGLPDSRPDACRLQLTGAECLQPE
eukprot:862589-Pelagomonas_calceolata.AAC.3